MRLNAKEHESIKRYLLGQVPQEEQSRIEERLLSETVFYEELVIVEDELIDDYVTDELSEVERRAFETHFLVAPERQQKVRFARNLRRYVNDGRVGEVSVTPATVDPGGPSEEVDEPPPKRRSGFWFSPVQNPILSYSIAAAILVVAIGVPWLLYKNQQNAPRPRSSSVFAVNLTPGLTREGSEENRTIRIPASTGEVELRLALPSNEYPNYRAELVNGERATVLVKEDLRPETSSENRIISLTLPAALLTRDDYRVKLSGRRADGSYEVIAGYGFRIVD